MGPHRAVLLRLPVVRDLLLILLVVFFFSNLSQANLWSNTRKMNS